MANRWTHDQGRSAIAQRQRFEMEDYGRGDDRFNDTRGFDYGGGGLRGEQERSFQPGYGRGGGDDRDYGGGDRQVFGERETGASYNDRYGGGQSYGGGYGGGQSYGQGSSGGRYYGDTGRGWEGQVYSGQDRGRGWQADSPRGRFGEESRFGGYEGDYGRRGGYGGFGSRYASQGGGDISTGYEADRYRGGGRDWSAGDAGYSRYAGGYGGQDRDRGFFERAGERISSWFSDDDDRERGRHRGRGPAGYKRSDARISEDIHDRLTDDDHLDASNIQVEVKEGEVTLSGTVTDREDKHRAERLAERVQGVEHVQNNIRVDKSRNDTGSQLFGGSFSRDEQNARNGGSQGQNPLNAAPDPVKAVSEGKS